VLSVSVPAGADGSAAGRTRLEEGQQVVVHLRVALQPLERELGGGHLAVPGEQLAHLAVEDLLARAQGGDLGGHLAAHLRAHLAQPVVDGLQPRVLVGYLEREVRALEDEVALGGGQLGHGRIGGIHVDAVVAAAGVARQARLHALQLDPLLPRLLDVPAHLGEQREEHGGLGAGRDDAVGVAERPDLLLGPLHPALHLAQLGLDELPRLRHAGVAVRLVVLPVDLGDGVGQLLRLARVRGGGGDVDDARARDTRGLDLAAEAVERRLVGARLAHRLPRRRLRQLAHPPRDLLEHGIALDQRDLRLDVVRAVDGEDLDEQPGEGRGLLELHRGGGLVDGDLLLGEPEAEERDEDRADDDDHPPAADDQPVVPQVHLVLRHA
jgi:hypothetical protein